MTNREKLNQLSDEDLSQVLSNMCPPKYCLTMDLFSRDICPRIRENEKYRLMTGECTRCWMDWLRREATE